MADAARAAASQRRSSSQTSSSSRRSQTIRSARSKPHKHHSTSSSNTTTTTTAADLTSFPSLSPDASPEGFRGQPALNHALSQALLAEGGTESDSAREIRRSRQETLDKLTANLSLNCGRAALFDDSVSTADVPGALHLADDAHIQRLIERNGAVKLVRQFARDLALRDAEISKLRRRADARERELKRMLREVSVSSQDIERRLQELDNTLRSGSHDGENGSPRTSSTLNGLMGQAMLDPVGKSEWADFQSSTFLAQNETDAKSGASSNGSGPGNKRTSRSWQDYFFGSTNTSRKTSRASSIVGDVDSPGEEVGQTAPGTDSRRRKPLDGDVFQPPQSRSESPVGLSHRKDGADDASIHSRKSTSSIASWTVRLFAGNGQARNSVATSNRASSQTPSAVQDRTRRDTGTLTPSSSKGGLSAVAALKRINSSTGVSTLPDRPSASGGATRQRRAPAGSISHGPNPDRNPESVATNLGPVEMDAILPMESRPPTITHIYDDDKSDELLTDRFGFIYDQRRRKRQKEPIVLKNKANRSSMAETISSYRSEEFPDEEGGLEDRNVDGPSTTRSATLASFDDGEPDAPPPKRWQDYLRIATNPTELLSHTPSAAPIVRITADEDVKKANSSIAVDKSGGPCVSSNTRPTSSTSAVVADSPEFAGSSNPARHASTGATSSEQEPVKMLLEQLTELHDNLQRERTKRWNEFLRKVRAERRREGEAAAAMDPDRANLSLAMPEVSLADGEVVGIAGLGNKGKVGRNKWREFRSLVLGGIPVAHRAKIWAECTGASAMRIPGYYDELVNGVGAAKVDEEIVAQIDMDIHRTLTDNVFFRKGPGVAKLREVLLAYSRRNPEVGYCQGMNLIAASLLLIMPTAEDAFWLLASMIENILPQHYYDHGLLASRADQHVLRQYIREILPRLSAHLDNLGVELEALTFQWFLSVFTDCLSAEALYRVWDVVLCLNATSTPQRGTPATASKDGTRNGSSSKQSDDTTVSSGSGSTFLFQVALALLKLNEPQLLACSNSAAVYTYVNHQMTNHAISIDGLIQASEALRNVVRREDIVARRAETIRWMQNGHIGSNGHDAASSN